MGLCYSIEAEEGDIIYNDNSGNIQKINFYIDLYNAMRAVLFRLKKEGKDIDKYEKVHDKMKVRIRKIYDESLWNKPPYFLPGEKGIIADLFALYDNPPCRKTIMTFGYNYCGPNTELIGELLMHKLDKISTNYI